MPSGAMSSQRKGNEEVPGFFELSYFDDGQMKIKSWVQLGHSSCQSTSIFYGWPQAMSYKEELIVGSEGP